MENEVTISGGEAGGTVLKWPDLKQKYMEHEGVKYVRYGNQAVFAGEVLEVE